MRGAEYLKLKLSTVFKNAIYLFIYQVRPVRSPPTTKNKKKI